MSDLSRLAGFEAFVADQAQPLARTALLLAGDPRSAHALVVRTLARVASRWSALRWASPAESARNELFTRYLKKFPGHGDSAGLPSAAHLDVPATPGRSYAREALAALSPLRRALVVAHFHERLPEWPAAKLCGVDVPTAQAEIALALEELLHRVPGLSADPEPTSPTAAGPGATSTTGTTPTASTASITATAFSGTATGAGSNVVLPDERNAREPQAREASSATVWASPTTESNVLASATSWASPTPEPEISGFPKDPAWASVPPSVVPWGGSAAPAEPTGPVRTDPIEEALRRELDAIASEMPPVRVADEVLNTARRRRAFRVSLIVGGCVTLAAAIIVPFVFGVAVYVSAVRGASDRAVPEDTTDDPYYGIYEDDLAEEGPGTLPSVVDTPISYAYRTSCVAAQASSGCEEWRVITEEGQAYLIPDAGVEDSPRANHLLVISRDGNQIAYYSSSLSEFVIVDRRHSVPEAAELIPSGQELTKDTSLTISPTGRWLATDFGFRKGAGRPRLHDVTAKRTWTLPQRMRILAVSDDGTVLGTIVTRVNTTRVTELVRMRPTGRVLSRVRFGAGSLATGTALSRDGLDLALIKKITRPGKAERRVLVTVDPATGRIRNLCAPDLPRGLHAVRVRSWVNDREVIVEATRRAGGARSIHAVDVLSGVTRGVILDEQNRFTSPWTPGSLG
ncbi:hypothetical protein [Microtetraspora sp. NBRC 16547]|uniref:hypothetical protein n=1 Tax=Microtetraspora sp. NBRC 16547 TaxID=3030993 RepID=UPI002556E301|nr:hypothetical protein [Microtetraspora sp. NBRC 16547]